jgi:uncharacterized coiled-coil DUF342 family protein
MTGYNQLAEHDIDQYESQLKHIDELLGRAKGIEGGHEYADIHAQIASVKNERDRYARHIDALKQKSTDDLHEEMIKDTGPLGIILDALAQQMQSLLERIERK